MEKSPGLLIFFISCVATIERMEAFNFKSIVNKLGNIVHKASQTETAAVLGNLAQQKVLGAAYGYGLTITPQFISQVYPVLQNLDGQIATQRANVTNLINKYNLGQAPELGQSIAAIQQYGQQLDAIRYAIGNILRASQNYLAQYQGQYSQVQVSNCNLPQLFGELHNAVLQLQNLVPQIQAHVNVTDIDNIIAELLRVCGGGTTTAVAPTGTVQTAYPLTQTPVYSATQQPVYYPTTVPQPSYVPTVQQAVY
ncbi:MAG: hypothetical protein LBG20_03170 [Holosporaceae bacterium]|jgi:branched-subunit amino acid transport protein|nr:hypothetical protein [Holosporaceae bacterium]